VLLASNPLGLFILSSTRYRECEKNRVLGMYGSGHWEYDRVWDFYVACCTSGIWGDKSRRMDSCVIGGCAVSRGFRVAGAAGAGR
jgi:hypothetical protein